MREERSLAKLALEIVTKLDQDSSVWKKWEGPRDKILGAAIECWIPKEDMLEFLNSLPGPALTVTDLEQRMKSMIEEEYLGDPEPKLEAECLAIYQAEKEAGTEMPAIIGRLADYTSAQFQRLRDERRAEEERRLDEARLERERRLLSYADCPWTQIKGSKFVYCRKNGRVFQLKPNSDKSLTLYRVQAVDDAAAGEMIGRYRSRGDASKVVAKAAYEPEPWR
jgi:RNA polymerase-binding transcription factor DksA